MSILNSESNPNAASFQPTASSDRIVRWSCIAALLIALASYFTISGSPFYDPDEFNYITAARTMVEQGDWITPHFNGDPRLYKPVMFYWIVAVAYKTFGVHIAVARLCSTAAAAVGVFGVWLIARHLLGKRPALLAATIAAGHLTVLQISRSAITDTTLWAFCTLAQYGLVRLAFPLTSSNANDLGAEPDTPIRPARFAWLFFIGLSLALLTKGPVAFLWCLIPAVWLAIRRDWRALASFRWLRGLLILLLLVGPWASVFIYRNHEALRAILWDPNSHESYAQFSRPAWTPASMLQIFAQLIPSILPWLPLIVAACIFPRRGGFTTRTKCVGFLLFWFVVVLVLLTVNDRKSFRYMFPLIVPTSLLLAGWLDAALNSGKLRKALSDVALVYGIVAWGIALTITAVIVCTHGLDTGLLWIHVAIQLILAIVLLQWRHSPTLHRLMPAMMVAALYLHSGLINVTLQPLMGRRIAAMAPRVERSLDPDDRLVLYNGLSPRYLVFMARRNISYALTYDNLLSQLETAKACLMRERDWQTVPESTRSQFAEADRCIVQREPALATLDLGKNLEPAVLMVRKQPTTTQPSSAPSP